MNLPARVQIADRDGYPTPAIIRWLADLLTFSSLKRRGLDLPADVSAGGLQVDASGNVILATGAQLATDATTGFAYLPTCGGAPTGTPGVLPAGAAPVVIDAANSKLYVYLGGAWVGADLT